MRRRFVIILLSLLMFSFDLFALLSYVGPETKNGVQSFQPPAITQEIYGYIDSIGTKLEISSPKYVGSGDKRGFNLDIADSANALRYQIAPTQTALTIPGALIGTFSLITSDSGVTLKVTHTPLHLESNPTIIVDYELGISWDWNGVIKNAMCLSASDYMVGVSVNEANRSILIPLTQNNNTTLVRLQNSGIHFRLTPGEAAITTVTEPGVYYSIVYFEIFSGV